MLINRPHDSFCRSGSEFLFLSALYFVKLWSVQFSPHPLIIFPLFKKVVTLTRFLFPLFCYLYLLCSVLCNSKASLLGQLAAKIFLCQVLPVEMWPDTDEEVRTEGPGSLGRHYSPPYACSVSSIGSVPAAILTLLVGVILHWLCLKGDPAAPR